MYQSKRTALKYIYKITAKEIYTKHQQINVSLVKQMLYEGNLIDPKEFVTIIKDFQNIISTQLILNFLES